MDTSYCQQILLQELETRKERNPHYSLRAFARDLGVGSTSLSDVLAAKRNFSRSNLDKISEKLCLSPEQRDAMLAEVATKQTKKTKEEIERLQLAEAEFRLIADWYYLAILSLAETDTCSSESKDIAERLGITLKQVNDALATLLKMGLIDKKDGILSATGLAISTTRDIPSRAIRKHHRDNLRLAENCLEDVDISM